MKKIEMMREIGHNLSHDCDGQVLKNGVWECCEILCSFKKLGSQENPTTGNTTVKEAGELLFQATKYEKSIADELGINFSNAEEMRK